MANGQNFGTIISRQVTGFTSTVSTAETTMATLSLPPVTLGNPGEVIKFRAWGTGVNNANTKTLKVYFGASTLTFTIPASIAAKWCVDVHIVHVSASVQQMIGTMVTTNASTSNDCQTAAPTEDATTALTVKVTGTATTTGDITMTGLIIEKIA